MGSDCILSNEEIEAVIKLTPEKKYKYFLNKVSDWGGVWTIKNNDGFLLYSDDFGNECVPLWPSDKYAILVCTCDWSDAQPHLISLPDFMGRWIPGIKKDGRSIAIFPSVNDQGVVVLPESLQNDLYSKLDEIE